jgi:SAM-dependent methyltransferase
MTRALYQSHSDTEKGMVDSASRLVRMMLPQRLDGAAVLDIGCNEGFFCGLAAERGAVQVIGIDADPVALAFARQRYPQRQIEFRQQPWRTLPDGPFDLVMWTSAMHYEPDPLSVLREVARRLKPGGLFVLECGTVATDARETLPVQRHDGTHLYPSMRLLREHLLRDFAWREVAGAEMAGSDPVPRYVFHCSPKRPTVIVFRGRPGQGKSVAAWSLHRSATKTILLDLFLHRVATAKYHHTRLEKFIKENNTGRNLGLLYEGIDTADLTSDYAQSLARTIAPSDEMVVIDGYMTDAQFTALQKACGGHVKLWDAQACD